MAKAKAGAWIVTIKVKGPKPDVRTLCGDTIFLRMDEGQTATWTLKRERPGK